MDYSKKLFGPDKIGELRWSEEPERYRRETLKDLSKIHGDKFYRVRESSENFHGLYPVSSSERLQATLDNKASEECFSIAQMQGSYQSMHFLPLGDTSSCQGVQTNSPLDSDMSCGLPHLVKIMPATVSPQVQKVPLKVICQKATPLFSKSTAHSRVSHPELLTNLKSAEINQSSKSSHGRGQATHDDSNAKSNNIWFEDPFLARKPTKSPQVQTLFPRLEKLQEFRDAQQASFVTPLPKPIDSKQQIGSLEVVTEIDESVSKEKVQSNSALDSEQMTLLSSTVISTDRQSIIGGKGDSQGTISLQTGNDEATIASMRQDIHSYLGSIEKNLKHLVKKCKFYKKKSAMAAQKSKKENTGSNLSTNISEREKGELFPQISDPLMSHQSPYKSIGPSDLGSENGKSQQKPDEKVALFFKRTGGKAKPIEEKSNGMNFKQEISSKQPSFIGTNSNFNPFDFGKKTLPKRLFNNEVRETTGSQRKSPIRFIAKEVPCKTLEIQSPTPWRRARRMSTGNSEQNKPAVKANSKRAKLSISASNLQYHSSNSSISQSTSKRKTITPLGAAVLKAKEEAQKKASSKRASASTSKRKEDSNRCQSLDNIGKKKTGSKDKGNLANLAANRTRQLEKVLQHLKKINTQGQVSMEDSLQRYDEKSKSQSLERKKSLDASTDLFFQCLLGQTKPREDSSSKNIFLTAKNSIKNAKLKSLQ
jgi:hypothetical protein